jgi:hypothetical protein
MCFPQWLMPLVAILAMHSNQGSLLEMQRFAERHHKILRELLCTQMSKHPSDSNFLLRLAQRNVEGFEALRWQ